MTADKNRPESEVRRQLELGRERIDYDVEAGLRRHRELVTRGAPIPSWADGLEVPRALWRARTLTGLTVLMLGGAGILALRQAPPAASELPHLPAAAHADSAPTVQPTAHANLTPSAADAPAIAVAAERSPARLSGAASPAPALPEPSNAENAAVSPTDPADRGVPDARAVRGGLPQERVVRGRASRRPSLPKHAANPRAHGGAVTTAPAAEPAFPSARELLAGLDAPGSAGGALPASTPAISASAASSVESARRATSDTDRAASAPASGVRVVASPRAPVIVDERPAVVVEMQELSRAEGMLEKDPAVALQLVRASIAKHPSGFLEQERRYVEVMAMIALRRVEEARLLGREFIRAYPQGPFRRRVDTAISEAIRAQ